jgi:stage IV sporulation protein FB
MSTPVQGGRPLARFRVLGFPVHVDWTFVLFVGILGWRPGVTWQELGIWLALAFVAVLVHELGHAVAARRTGAHPAIALVALGGVTTYAPPRPLSRLTSLGISLAGPAVGLVLGGLLLVVARSVEIDPYGLGAYTLNIAVFTTLGWSVLNLLPIVPLDGGQAMRELLPGDPVTRSRRASIISIVLAVGLGFLALVSPVISEFALIFAVFLVLVNVVALRSTSAAAGAPAGAGRPRPAPGLAGGSEDGAVRLLWEGRPEDARALLERIPPGGRPDLALHGAVLATTGQREQGFALLYQEWARRPGDGHVTALIALAHLLLGEWRDIARLLTGPSASSVPPAIVARAIATARASGDEEAARDLERVARIAATGTGETGDPAGPPRPRE